MAGLQEANPAVIATVKAVNGTVTEPTMSRNVGSGAAFQSVSQSTAIAIQDATEYVRNITAMSSTAIGMSLAKLVATKDLTYKEVITIAQNAITTASNNMKEIGTVASDIAKNYPIGKS